jgi:hypothetical protein
MWRPWGLLGKTRQGRSEQRLTIARQRRQKAARDNEKAVSSQRGAITVAAAHGNCKREDQNQASRNGAAPAEFELKRSRRSVSIATPNATRGTDCDPETG